MSENIELQFNHSIHLKSHIHIHTKSNGSGHVSSSIQSTLNIDHKCSIYSLYFSIFILFIKYFLYIKNYSFLRMLMHYQKTLHFTSLF
ncbi:MAG: hypothetical protein Q8S84_00160 [bacterium]|nr:hypothetical protein [bacterium]